jgi:hypothetical protein
MFDGRVFQQTVDIPMGTKCPFSPTCSFIRNRQNSYQSESRLDNGVISINLSRTYFTGIGHVLEYIDQVLKIHLF